MNQDLNIHITSGGHLALLLLALYGLLILASAIGIEVNRGINELSRRIVKRIEEWASR